MIKFSREKAVRQHLDHVKSRTVITEESKTDELMFPAMEHGDDAADDTTSNTDTDPDSDSSQHSEVC